MNTLFDYISQGRPERVVQGALQFALLNEPKLRTYVARELGLGMVFPAAATVKLEQKTVWGWRADLELHWAGNKKPTRLELKLSAGLTRRQIEAGQARKIDGMVVPSGGQKGGFGRVFTWMELADVVENQIVRQLFAEADTAASWAMHELPKAVLEAEFSSCMRGGPEGRWPSLYRFLMTIHQHLSEATKSLPKYAMERCRVSRRDRYYGYAFTVGQGRHAHWLGFSAHDGELRFVLIDERTGKRLLEPPADSFRAAALAKRILKELG